MDIYKERISPLLKSTGKSKSDLEKEIGIPQKTISRWDAGLNQSYKNYISKIASYLNVSTDYLLGTPDKKNKPTAETDDELVKLLNDPTNKAIFEKLSKLSEENLDLAAAQIDLLLARQEKQEKK